MRNIMEELYEFSVLKKQLYWALYFLNKTLCLPVDIWYMFDNIKNAAGFNKCIRYLILQDLQEKHFISAMGLSPCKGFLDAIRASEDKAWLWQVYGYYLNFQHAYTKLKQWDSSLRLKRQHA
jgi:hypothetical protein